MKLLAVDDSRVVRRKIARAIETIGFEEVLEADSSEQALQVYEGSRPDIVTINISMPEKDGLACIEKLKAFDANVLILAIYSQVTEDLTNEAMTLGARSTIQEPFRDEQISSVIQNLMAKAVNETGFRKIPDFSLYTK